MLLNNLLENEKERLLSDLQKAVPGCIWQLGDGKSKTIANGERDGFALTIAEEGREFLVDWRARSNFTFDEAMSALKAVEPYLKTEKERLRGGSNVRLSKS